MKLPIIRLRRCLIAASLLTGLAACAAGYGESAPDAAANDAPIASDRVAAGSAFAVAHCSGCHAVAADGISPNPQSPSFEAVVNRPGVTRETLVPWLDNSHYYPDVMDFRIGPGDVEMLADYMLTLQDERYRPLPH